MDVIEALEREQMRLDIPDFRSGDTVKVHAKIKEGDKERIQVFQGVVIRKRKGKMGADLYRTEGLLRDRGGTDFSLSLSQY